MVHKKQTINIKNKRAYFDYEILEKFVAGIQLVGTEIKSIRNGKASIGEAYCRFTRQELYVVNMNISEYDFGKKVIFGHTPFPTPYVTLNKIGLDTGAVFGNKLTCLELPDEKFYHVGSKQIDNQLK